MISSVRWTYTSWVLWDAPEAKQTPIIKTEDFTTREAAESFACRMAIDNMMWIYPAKRQEEERELVAEDPDRLMDYGWLCDRVKRNGWFNARRNPVKVFKWTIQETRTKSLRTGGDAKKKPPMKIDVNDGWQLLAWRKMKGRLAEQQQKSADRQDTANVKPADGAPIELATAEK